MSTRIRQLDGLRALAVLAVIQQHWGVAPINRALGPGGFGVDLFFVLSGFLITGILLQARQAGDRASGLVTFYLRRALRIFPAYYLTLLVAGLVTRDVSADWGWHAAYLSNVKLAIDQTWPGSAAHLWSLSVEQQFYLAWPAVVLVATRGRLEPVVAGIALGAPIWRAGVLAASGGNGFLAVNSLPGAADCLAAGAWLACRARRDAPPLPSAVFGAGLLLWTLCRAAGWLLPGSWLSMVFGGSADALMFAWVVDRVARQTPGTHWLAWRPLVHVGVVSYGVYLVHNFVPALTNLVAPRLATWLYAHGAGPFVAITLISVGLATVSWYAVEEPINRLKHRLPYGKRNVTAAPEYAAL